ncbi:MAG: hypothetical protein MUC58_11820 [Rhizobiaceae bacterium]|jgi:hypothetical protein|nr:hypothetical protein [Rhizobiaceae bacterium]
MSIDIIITPRLTLRPPIDWDIDDIADIAGAEAAGGVLARATHVLVRERVIGWVEPGRHPVIAPGLAGNGFEDEALAALDH